MVGLSFHSANESLPGEFIAKTKKGRKDLVLGIMYELSRVKEEAPGKIENWIYEI